MTQNKITKEDRIQLAMFSPERKLKKPLSLAETAVMKRYESGFLFWQGNSHLSKTAVANFLMNTHNISKRQAYLDTGMIEQLLSNIKETSSLWIRHMVIEMLRKSYTIALAKKDPKAMTLAADKIGKYSKLDKDEADTIPWETLSPPNFEPAADPTVLGLEPIDNIEQVRKQLREKYLKKFRLPDIQDAQIIDE